MLKLSTEKPKRAMIEFIRAYVQYEVDEVVIEDRLFYDRLSVPKG